MKLLFSLTFILASIAGVDAQKTFDSPYVHEGRTFQIKYPDNLYKSVQDEKEAYFFTTNPDITAEDLEDPPMEDIMVIGFLPFDFNIMKMALNANEEEISEMLGEDIKFIEPITKKTYSGREFYQAVFTLDDDDEEMELGNVHGALTGFGNYTVLFMVMEVGSERKLDAKATLKQVLNSYTEMDTDRKSELEEPEVEGLFDVPPPPLMAEHKVEYDTDVYKEWQDTVDLTSMGTGLSRMVHKDGLGEVNVFHAYRSEEYKNMEDLIADVNQRIGKQEGLAIEPTSDFPTPFHLMSRYKIKKNKGNLIDLFAFSHEDKMYILTVQEFSKKPTKRFSKSYLILIRNLKLIAAY